MTFTRVLAGVGVATLAAIPLLAGTSAALAAPTGGYAAPMPIVRQATGMINMPSSYPYQAPLAVRPETGPDASTDRGLMRYDEIAPKLNTLMASSDRVSAQVVGKSGEGRDIYMVTVTAPETAAETRQQAVYRDTIKHDAAAAATNPALAANYKVPTWFNGNIHGNEWEGTDAILKTIGDLAADQSPATADMLSKNRFYFTLTNNPDGRVNGTRAVADGFDPNRDFITGVTAEASVTRDLAPILQPTFFVDIHGYTGILQVEPCGPPHGENYEYDLFLPHAYNAALEMEQAVVAANIPGNTYLGVDGRPTTSNTGKIKIPYRDIRDGWDDWPPIFAPQYISYQGAITNTVELPHGRINNDPVEGTRRANVNLAVADVVINTALDYVVDNSGDLLSNQVEIFRRGAAGEPQRAIPATVQPGDFPGPTQWTDIWDDTDVYNTTYPRAYVIPMDDTQRSLTDAATVVDQLLVSGVQVQQTTSALTANGKTYPAGSYYVDMHQPLRGMANVLLADGTDITQRVSTTYDISAWSLARLWGANVDAIGTTTDPAPAVTAARITTTAPTGTVPAQGTYLEMKTAGVAEYQAINTLLGNGIAVSAFDDGSVILGNDADTHAAATQVAADYGVTFTASDGKRLVDEPSRGLSRMTVGYVGNQDDKFSLLKSGFTDLVQVNATNITNGTVDLSQIDMLWIGSTLTFSAEQSAGQAAVASYLAAGKGVTGRGTAVSAFTKTFGLMPDVVATSGTSGSNGIVAVDTSTTGLFGAHPQTNAFISPAVWYSNLPAGAQIDQRYAVTDTLVAGHWGTTPNAARARTDAAGQASIVSMESAAGNRVVMFGISPNYRTHPVGAFSLMARSILWAGVAGAEVPVPVDVPVVPVDPTVPGETDPGAAPGETPGGSTPGSASGSSTPAGKNSSALPRTGAESEGLMVLTGVLLLAGAGLFAGDRVRRRMRRASAE